MDTLANQRAARAYARLQQVVESYGYRESGAERADAGQSSGVPAIDAARLVPAEITDDAVWVGKPVNRLVPLADLEKP